MMVFFYFSGRILNRFTKDTGIIDEMLPRSMADFIAVSRNILNIILYVNLMGKEVRVRVFKPIRVIVRNRCNYYEERTNIFWKMIPMGTKIQMSCN